MPPPHCVIPISMQQGGVKPSLVCLCPMSTQQGGHGPSLLCSYHFDMVRKGPSCFNSSSQFYFITNNLPTLSLAPPWLGTQWQRQCLPLLFPNASKALERAFNASEPAEMLQNTKDISLWVCFSCFEGIYPNPWPPARKQASVEGMFSCSRVPSPPMPRNNKNLPNLCNGCGFGVGPGPSYSLYIYCYSYYIVIHCYQTRAWTCESCQNLESDYCI